MDGTEVLRSDTTTATYLVWLGIAGRILYYVTFPIVKLLEVLLVVVLYLLRVILSPVIYIGKRIVEFCLIPYYIAARFEAICYFIGGAILVGVVSGLLLHGILRTFILVFKLDRKSTIRPKSVPATGHDVKSYRKARERKREQAVKEQQELDARARALADSPLVKDALKQMQRDSPEGYISPNGRRRDAQRSLLDQTIIEHSDEEDS